MRAERSLDVMILSAAPRRWNIPAMSVATPRLALAVAAIFLAFAALAQTLTFPTLTGRVVDEAGLLGQTDRA